MDTQGISIVTAGISFALIFLSLSMSFFAEVSLPRDVASTLMVLLPKTDSTQTFANYQPISLCNFLNKIFTRVIRAKLKPLLPKIISEEQFTFVQGLEVIDNVLLVHELLQYLDKKVRGHNLLFKLDMMKAFDRVSWEFLKLLLGWFGFHSRFVDLVMNNLCGA